LNLAKISRFRDTVLLKSIGAPIWFNKAADFCALCNFIHFARGRHSKTDPQMGLLGPPRVTAAIGQSTKEWIMRTFIKLVPVAGLAAVLLGGCAYRGHDRMVTAGHGGYYDGYYDGSYGAFNDGYWGNDGAFYYSDGDRNWHRDEGRHFRRDSGEGDTWVRVRGSGANRDH